MNNTPDNWAVRYFTLWIGQALSLLGSQLVQFAIIWYLTETTNSATTLAIASMMGLLPQVLLSPFIGTWVDRGNRRLIIITADTTVALATIVVEAIITVGQLQGGRGRPVSARGCRPCPCHTELTRALTRRHGTLPRCLECGSQARRRTRDGGLAIQCEDARRAAQQGPADHDESERFQDAP